MRILVWFLPQSIPVIEAAILNEKISKKYLQADFLVTLG
jgi:hypothetical protein